MSPSTTADPGSGRPGPARACPVRAADPRHWPWWLQVLAVHALARAVSGLVLVLVARTQQATPWTGESPGYLEYTGLMWDGAWYREIAGSGYPDGLPVGPDGAVQQNAWAFFPLFPLMARALITVTGLPWHVVAPLLATTLGALAMLVVHRVVAEGVDRTVRPPPDGAGIASVTGRSVGLVTVAVLTTSAAAPVLQVAYTESLALLLVAAVLWCLVGRRYLLAVPLVLALGLTRAVALPVGVAVLAHLVVRWRAGARPRALAPVVGLGLAAGAAGVLWPAYVALRTGVPDAYTQTQAAWRGTGAVVPVRPWADVAGWLLGPWGVPVLVVLVAATAAAVLSEPVRRLGPELQAWAGGYLAYLLVVLEPGTSLVRLTLLAFPLAGGLAVLVVRVPGAVRRRLLLAALLVVGTVAQVAWVSLLWRLVPPAGWPP